MALISKSKLLFGRRRSSSKKGAAAAGCVAAATASSSTPPTREAIAEVNNKSYYKRLTAETADTAHCSSDDSDGRSVGVRGNCGASSSSISGGDDGSDTFVAANTERGFKGYSSGPELAAECDSSSVDREVDNATRDASSCDEDDSAYHSRSDAILVWTSDRTDDEVSQLGASLLRLDEAKGPPFEEITIETSVVGGIDDAGRSAASELTSGSRSKKSKRRSSMKSAECHQQDQEHSEQPSSTSDGLIDMAERLRHSKAELVRALSSAISSSNLEEDLAGYDSLQELKENTRSLLSEIDALLMQLGTLALKGRDSRIVRGLERCREITLTECEEVLHRADMFAVAVSMRRKRFCV